jgi:hypothetical protein
MTLNLVHGRNYYVGELEQVSEVSRRYVGDTCQRAAIELGQYHKLRYTPIALTFSGCLR